MLTDFVHLDTGKHISVRRGENGRVTMSRCKLPLEPSPSQPPSSSKTPANVSDVLDDVHLSDPANLDFDLPPVESAHATKPSKKKRKKASASIGVSQVVFIYV
jgi:hypothetical protein